MPSRRGGRRGVLTSDKAGAAGLGAAPRGGRPATGKPSRPHGRARTFRQPDRAGRGLKAHARGVPERVRPATFSPLGRVRAPPPRASLAAARGRPLRETPLPGIPRPRSPGSDASRGRGGPPPAPREPGPCDAGAVAAAADALGGGGQAAYLLRPRFFSFSRKWLLGRSVRWALGLMNEIPRACSGQRRQESEGGSGGEDEEAGAGAGEGAGGKTPGGIDESLAALSVAGDDGSGPPASYRAQLSKLEEAALAAAWSGRRAGDVAAKGELGLEVTYGDLRLLRGTTWVNDEIVNLYMQMVQRRSRGAPPGRPRVHSLSSFFWTKLACTPAGYNYAGVRRWTRRADLFAHDLVLAPINHGNVHWCLVAMYPRERRVEYYDSKHGGGRQVLSTMMRYLADEAEDKGKPPVVAAKWRQETMVRGVPYQEDGGSCGVFACTFAERLAAGGRPPFAFESRHVAGIRRGMVLDLLNARIA